MPSTIGVFLFVISCRSIFTKKLDGMEMCEITIKDNGQGINKDNIKKIGIIGTKATIKSKVYEEKINHLYKSIKVVSLETGATKISK